VTRGSASVQPAIAALSSLPPAGLSTSGGGLLRLTGSNLGLANSTVTLQLALPGSSAPYSSTCTVLQRQEEVLCPSPPGWGTNLTLSLLVGSNNALQLPAALSYAAPFTVGVAGAPAFELQAWLGAVELLDAPD
jgi:hypothetical protein